MRAVADKLLRPCLGWLLMDTSIVVQVLCQFPERLHPASQLFLDSFVAGHITRMEFVRYFSLPNSDYLALAYCFADRFVGGFAGI